MSVKIDERTYEQLVEQAKQRLKTPGEAPGLCCSCRYWHASRTQVARDSVEMRCANPNPNAAYGQDGKSVITQGDFGCVLYEGRS